jgi:hypothetical protein
MPKRKQNSLKEAPYRHVTKEYSLTEKRVVDVDYWELAEYADGYELNRIEWRPNEPFQANLRLIGYERGRSAARFVWEDWEIGTRYPMFMSSMVELLNHADVIQGAVSNEKWIVVKKGSNYGIERYVS